MKADHAQEYYVLPLWSSYTLTVKSSKAKNGDEKLNKDIDSKTNEEPVDQEDQAFLKELKRIKRQEKKANDAADTLRKTFAQSTENLLLQAGAARASNTNYVNTARTPVIAPSTPLNTSSTPTNQDDSQIPSLEDIYEVSRDGIFTSTSYDDEGAVAGFTNLETTVNVYMNKKDERGIVVRNKARLVAQGHRQEEWLDYNEVFAHVARIEAIRIFLAFASYMGFIVYQMDVKSAFLYGKINEEVYVSQPLGFIDSKFSNKVYKVVKALYGLHQAPRLWYATLTTFLVQSGYRRGLIDKNLFIKKDKKDIMLVQVYVDDIIFGSTKKSWCDEFEALMKNRFQMSYMGELTFFLGLQVNQKKDVCACFRFQITPKTSHLQAVKRIFRKSTTGGCQFLGRRLILWQCKKQTIVATSTTEAEYVAAASCCGQVLWIQNQIGSFKCWLITTPQMVINSPCLTHKKELAIPEQTTTGKELSNPLMVGSLPKTTLPTKLVNVVRLKLTTARVYVAEAKPIIMSTPPFAKTYNLIAYLEKPTESEGFAQIIDFLNGSSVKYALTASPTIYTSCIKQFWITAKVKTVNDEVRIQALVDGKRVNIKVSSIRRTLRFVQLIINHQLGDMAHHKETFDTPSLANKVFANMKRLMHNQYPSPLKHQLLNPKRSTNQRGSILKNLVPPTEYPAEQNLPLPFNDPLPSGEDSLKLKELMDLCINLSNKVLELKSEVIDIKSTYQEKIEKLEGMVERLEEENRMLKELKSVHSTDDANEPVMEKEKSSKQERTITDIDADVEINLEKAQAKAYNLDLDLKAAKLMTELVTTAEATKVSVPRKRRGVIIQDPEESITTATVRPKNAVIEQVKRNERLNNAIMKYQTLKWKPLTQPQARRNMIVSLKNMANFKMDYFKGMTYDEIKPFFKKHYNFNQTFLDEANEEVKVSETEVRQEKDVEVESSKREDATPLASKIPIVDYNIHTKRNRPYFKINRVDGNHMLFISLSTMLKNFDRKDLESLWIIVRDRSEKTKPKNYSYDYLLNTLKIMFEKSNVEASVWKDQKGRYGLANVKSWKLIELCGVHCIAFLITQIFLLVERMYSLTHFTLEQMLNSARIRRIFLDGYGILQDHCDCEPLLQFSLMLVVVVVITVASGHIVLEIHIFQEGSHPSASTIGSVENQLDPQSARHLGTLASQPRTSTAAGRFGAR
nr:hypothetical protein [Tanacetum cinerariifolium]